MLSIPFELVGAIEAANCVLFLGAGIGKHLYKPDGSNLPTGSELAHNLTKHFGTETVGCDDLAIVSKVVELEHGRAELISYLQIELADVEPDETFLWLLTNSWKAIYTTNYDMGIERAFEMAHDKKQECVPISISSEVKEFHPSIEVPIFYLHGKLFGESNSSIVITKEDYSNYLKSRAMLFNFLKGAFATCPILYIGYGNQDRDWDIVLNEVSNEIAPLPLPTSYRVAPNTPVYEKRILDSMCVRTLDGTLHDFVASASSQITPYNVTAAFLDKQKETIPRDLEVSFEDNPRATSKLLMSWSYVNSERFDQRPNTGSFFRGEKPNWGLIRSCVPFERDIEGELFDEIIEYAGSSNPKARSVIVLGPAGYGITTLLMHLAAQTVMEDIGPVFWLRDIRFLEYEDIRFAISSFMRKAIFFVDNASMCASKLASIIHRLRETPESALFILGSRLNEWKQCGKKPRSTEILMERLSEQEIHRLLICLANNGQLGCLEGLSYSLQVNIIKQKYGKELLVAMKEATEGTAYDAILEEEFVRINSDLAQKAYLLSCCTYQFGSTLREHLLIEILHVEAAELYEELDKSTQGVLIRECVNEWTNEYTIRPRHRVIAEIVWKRCVTKYIEGYLLLMLNHLNLNYSSDRYVFDSLVTSDETVDAISDLEGRKLFFEEACKKDPNSPFVRQHYSRMLLRSELPEQALEQIEISMQINPQIRSLHHTKGIILQKIVLDTTNHELARKIMVRSEKCFKDAISMNNRDSYAWHGLADLYKCWAEKTQSDADRVRYIAKAEETISNGLKVVYDRERLLVLSGKISKMVGNERKYYIALERAVNESQGSLYSSYALSKAYYYDSKYDEAIEILEELISNDSIDSRAVLLYAKAKLKKGAELSEVINILRIGELDGLADPEYSCFLAGTLFLNKEFTKAEQIFQRSLQRNFSAEERRKIYFWPTEPDQSNSPLRLSGRVISVEGGYSLIEVTGYPRLFVCPASKYQDLVIQENDVLSFQLVFTGEKPLAVSPQRLSEQ